MSTCGDFTTRDRTCEDDIYVRDRGTRVRHSSHTNIEIFEVSERQGMTQVPFSISQPPISTSREGSDNINLPYMHRRQHPCDVCGHVFMRPNDLKRHTLKHTGEKPFKCNLCGAAYQRKEGVQQHMIKKHRI